MSSNLYTILDTSEVIDTFVEIECDQANNKSLKAFLPLLSYINVDSGLIKSLLVSEFTKMVNNIKPNIDKFILYYNVKLDSTSDNYIKQNALITMS